MFRNYFKTAWRNLIKQKSLAFINVFGLSVGIACFSLFTLYAINEFNYDKFHENKANICRVYNQSTGKDASPASGFSYQPMPLGPALKTDFPDVENYVRFKENFTQSFVKVGSSVAREDLSYADPSFFEVFSFKLRSGSPATALKDLHSVVLTEGTAKELFGRTDPVGKTIEIKTDDEFLPFTITAVAENPPSNSSIQYKMLANFNFLATMRNGEKRSHNWSQYSYQTYVQLKPGSRLPSETNTLTAFRKKYYPNDYTAKDATPNQYGFQPLTAIHTNPGISGGSVSPVDPKTIWILLGIAAGILLIACINFTTLAIGRSAGRSTEVGIRKVMGGNKSSLIRQFMVEAWLLAIISTVLGLSIAIALLPFFNDLSGKGLHFSLIQFPQLSWILLATIAIVSFLSGIYPALVLSGFKPVEALKTKIKLGGANFFTKSLVTVQFALSAALIISTVIILQQLHFLHSKNPGFNKENVVVVDAEGVNDTRSLYALFKQRLTSNREIIGTASAELGLGGDEGWSQTGFNYNGQNKIVYEYFIDPDYLRVLGLQLREGRNFEPGAPKDTVTSVIINETMMHNLGLTMQNVLGQRLRGYYDDVNDIRTPVVIGVVKDFNYLGLNAKIDPQMFHQFSSYRPFKFFVRIQPGEPSKAIAAIQTAWKTVAPDYPLKYAFLDENLDRFYKSEARWSSIVGWAGGISIFLACLGLLGLSTLAVINRTKEISIRKVLGAPVVSIVNLLAKDFLRLVAVAFVIATPLAWYFMNRWLQDYANRIAITWWVFAATGAVMLTIALVTISFQAIRAAFASPTASLR